MTNRLCIASKNIFFFLQASIWSERASRREFSRGIRSRFSSIDRMILRRNEVAVGDLIWEAERDDR